MKFSNFRLAKKDSSETEAPSERFVLIFKDVLYGHTLRIEVEREEFEEWPTGRYLEWDKIMRQTTFDEELESMTPQ